MRMRLMSHSRSWISSPMTVRSSRLNWILISKWKTTSMIRRTLPMYISGRTKKMMKKKAMMGNRR